ncbi:hypothetical protein EB796_019165 [Bugula neritina]|uniref:Uncharacterized protein n=1 Tax=Bugula neritina TaxID=10212 RepID=A0A7J7J8G9_BUGNE|nr:hypothetical protein EB796_019165 [Bugula neritina]
MHTEFSQKKKETFYRFEDLVTGYQEEEKLKELDKMIAEINRQAEIRRQEIKSFPAIMDKEVTSFTDELQTKEDQLGDLEHSLSLMMRECHVAEMIRQNKGNKEKIQQALALTTGSCNILREMVVAPTGNVGKFEASLRPLIPTKLTKLLTHPSNIQVSHMMLTDCGDLLFYSSGEVKIMDLNMKLTKASRAIGNVLCLAQFKDVVFVVTYAGNTLKCSSYRYGTLSELNEICEYPAEYISSSIAVCEKYVVLVNNASYTYCLRVYDHSGVHQRDVQVNRSIQGIWTLPNSSILIRTDQGQNLKLDTTTFVLHDCGKSSVAPLTTDGAGDELSVSLNTEEYRSIRSMSIKGSLLALTDDNSKIHLYHINY